jgi:hypothetical protein
MISDERRRLLELLETADDGCTAELLLTRGFTPDLVLGVSALGSRLRRQRTYLPEDARSWCPGCGSPTRAG